MIAAARRWTASGDALAEERVQDDVAHITESVVASMGSALVALVLVGSYARGEGGVVQSAHGPRAFNDFDLLCVLDGSPTAAQRSALRSLGAALEERRGVAVDLWPTTREGIAHAQRTLFWLDVAMGGARVLYGDERALDPVRSIRERDVSLDEAARLLANRAAGVALSRLATSPRNRHGEIARRWAEPAVVARHAHKAVLACGDALLLATRRYANTLQQRLAHLTAMCAGDDTLGELPSRYREALAFRLDATGWAPPRGQSVSDWNTDTLALVSKWHLRFERWRVGVANDALAYTQWRRSLYASSRDVQRSVAALTGALSVLRRGAMIAPWRLRMHPREQLARAAVGIAYAPESELEYVCHSTLGVGVDDALVSLEQLVQSAG